MGTWNDFSKRKHLKLAPLKPQTENTAQESSETEEKNPPSYEPSYAANPSAINESSSLVDPVDEDSKIIPGVEVAPNRNNSAPVAEEYDSIQEENVPTSPVDEEENPQYSKKAKRYLTVSTLLLIAGAASMLLALLILTIVLTANFTSAWMFPFWLWVATAFFFPSLVMAGLALHFTRKSIVYDQLNHKEPSRHQRTALWMSFLIIILSIIPFIARINYG